MSDSQLVTPDWVQAHIDSRPGPGWAYPFVVTWAHPLIAEGVQCFFCEKGFFHTYPSSYGIPMPFMSHEDGPRWIYYHRSCLLKVVGIEPSP